MKIGRIIIAVSILFSAFFLCSSFLSAQEEAVGKVVIMEGSAKIIRQGKTIPVALLSRIYPDDTIITRGGSRMKILFIDGSVLTIGNRTKISIEKFLYEKKEKKREASFNLTLGKVRTILTKASKDSLYEIKTPTAVAGARGTNFIVWVVSRGVTTVLVLEGEIDVGDIGGIGSQILGKNFALKIFKGKAPGSAYRLSPGEMKKLLTGLKRGGEGFWKKWLEKFTGSSGSVTEEKPPQEEIINQLPPPEPLPGPPRPPGGGITVP